MMIDQSAAAPSNRCGIALGRAAGMVLSPLLRRQGRQLRHSTARLPDPPGPRTGCCLGQFPDRPLRLLVVGESTALGVGVVDTRASLAPRLAARLAASSTRAVSWTIIGRTGATAARIPPLLPPRIGDRFDLVIVLLGVNDTLHLTSRRVWRRSIAGLCEALTTRLAPAALVVAVGPPDLRQFTALPQPLRGIMAWHAAALDRDLHRMAASPGPLTHVPTPPLEGPAMFAADRFHPSGYAYQRWADHIADAVWRGAPERWRINPPHLDC